MGVDRSIPGVDLYLELEIGPEATTDEIERAYRGLMKRHHPDRAGPEGLARSKRLNMARDWLVDSDRRARYDASRHVPRVEGSGPSGHADARARPPAPSRAPLAKPRPAPPRMAHARRTGRQMPASTATRLGLFGLVAVLAAFSAVGLGSSVSGRTEASAPGALGDASPTPTVEPTPTPTPEPTAVRTRASSPVATSTPTSMPAPTPTPVAPPAGRADIRFSGMYTEHVVQRLGGTSGCTATTGHGGTVTLTGFEIDSAPRSSSTWQLTLADLTSAWSMDMFFDQTANGLWWTSGVGPGSVTRTADGFEFDVVMTDSGQSLRAKGTVSCR